MSWETAEGMAAARGIDTANLGKSHRDRAKDELAALPWNDPRDEVDGLGPHHPLPAGAVEAANR